MVAKPFGRYQLREMLGRGGMGEVWNAFDSVTERIVAIKVLPTNLANDDAFATRFRREARIAASLEDPHIVPIYDYGEIDGRLFVAMRLIKGRDLESMLAAGPLPAARAVGIIEQVAWALHSAHETGLVHRDVKPSNVLVAKNDFVYLIDFGLARASTDTNLTSSGMIVGTWAYMSPERLNTGHADRRADVYALACVLHEALTGQRPFPGDSLEQQVVAHLTAPPPRPSALTRDVPPSMDAVIAAGMAKNPHHRYASTAELAAAARAALRVGPPRRQAAPVTRPAPTIPPPRRDPPAPSDPAFVSRTDEFEIPAHLLTPPAASPPAEPAPSTENPSAPAQLEDSAPAVEDEQSAPEGEPESAAEVAESEVAEDGAAEVPEMPEAAEAEAPEVDATELPEVNADEAAEVLEAELVEAAPAVEAKGPVDSPPQLSDSAPRTTPPEAAAPMTLVAPQVDWDTRDGDVVAATPAVNRAQTVSRPLPVPAISHTPDGGAATPRVTPRPRSPRKLAIPGLVTAIAIITIAVVLWMQLSGDTVTPTDEDDTAPTTSAPTRPSTTTPRATSSAPSSPAPSSPPPSPSTTTPRASSPAPNSPVQTRAPVERTTVPAPLPSAPAPSPEPAPAPVAPPAAPVPAPVAPAPAPETQQAVPPPPPNPEDLGPPPPMPCDPSGLQGPPC